MWAPTGLVPGSPVAAESGGLATAGGLDSGIAVLQMGSGMLEGHCCNLFSLSFQASQNITLITYASLQPSDRNPRIVLTSLFRIPGG